MKIRTQLILALLLLAVLPLTGSVVYSYVSSRRAVLQTVKAETEQLTADMNRRLAVVKADLKQRMDRLGGLSLSELAGVEVPEGAERLMVKRWLSELGDVAHLVESFEVIPMAPAPPLPVEGESIPVAPVAPAPAVPLPPAPVSPPALETIILDVTREHEERYQAGTGDAGEEIAHGIQLGVDVTMAVAEALGTLAARAEAAEGDEDEVEVERLIAAEEARVAGWEHWVERQAERAEGMAARPEHVEARRLLAERRRGTELVLGRELDFAVRDRGAAVGRVKPLLSAPKLLGELLRKTRRDQGEMPYALDAEDRLYVADEADRETLDGLWADGSPVADATHEDWVMAESEDPETGLRFGIVRPIGESLAAVDHAARRNLAFGLSLIGLACGGVLLLSTRMTRYLKTLTDGAERIAAGDLQTRVPVRSGDELGQLASAFNRMAGELSHNQEQLLEQERRRRRKEVEQQILEADNARKTRELEEARQFQLSLLPKTLPEHPAFTLAVHMETATEVGGDYYDFRAAAGGTLIAAIGDATGHGARAGTMVTVIKSLFSAASTEAGLGTFLGDAARAMKRMDLGRMNMALQLVELRAGARGPMLTVASAGMPPPLLHHGAEQAVEEISVPGLPLGTLASSYREHSLELEAGDTVLLMSDGFPELLDAGGEPLGYARVRELFAAAAARSPSESSDATPGTAGLGRKAEPEVSGFRGGGEPREIIADLRAAVTERTGSRPPSDDVTFVVLRVR